MNNPEIPRVMSNYVAATKFRYVRPEDSEFIIELRSDAKKSRHISPTLGDVEAQKEWISRYMKREESGVEHYFILEGATGDIGCVRIYEIVNRSFCWGSWIIMEGTPSYHAIETVLAIYMAGFDILNLEFSHFSVRKENKSVLKFHQSSGAVFESESQEDVFFRFYPESFRELSKRYHRRLRSL